MRWPAMPLPDLHQSTKVTYFVSRETQNLHTECGIILQNSHVNSPLALTVTYSYIACSLTVVNPNANTNANLRDYSV